MQMQSVGLGLTQQKYQMAQFGLEISYQALLMQRPHLSSRHQG
jgi:hypothetical protein